MLRAIGHEVRSPAAAMRSTLASLVQWRGLMAPERREELIEEAYDQSERLLRLAEAQLMIGKLETRDFEPQPVAVSLAEAAERASRVLYSRYGERATHIRLDLPEDLPDSYCEPTHLDQVLSNLLGNALEHTDASQLTVSAEREGQWLKVSVLDNGAGLPPERLERLFERGAFAGSHRARGGLGLGLYLCRLIVERSFGGRIWVERSGPQGTLIQFTTQAAA
jgi:two-component system sensor histidine kinase KdpD